jgi:hypothetical protein
VTYINAALSVKEVTVPLSSRRLPPWQKPHINGRALRGVHFSMSGTDSVSQRGTSSSGRSRPSRQRYSQDCGTTFPAAHRGDQ